MSQSNWRKKLISGEFYDRGVCLPAAVDSVLNEKDVSDAAYDHIEMVAGYQHLLTRKQCQKTLNWLVTGGQYHRNVTYKGVRDEAELEEVISDAANSGRRIVAYTLEDHVIGVVPTLDGQVQVFNTWEAYDNESNQNVRQDSVKHHRHHHHREPILHDEPISIAELHQILDRPRLHNHTKTTPKHNLIIFPEK